MVLAHRCGVAGAAPFWGERARSPDSLLLPRELCGAWIRPKRRHKLPSLPTGQRPVAAQASDEPLTVGWH
jgi:hypothetical protein